MLGYKTVTTPSSTTRAYDFVKEKILAGDFPGGTLISENSVASMLDMSRTPVRSAFQRLESEGWLTLYPKRGAVVTPSSPQEAVEILEARHLIEVHAVRTTAPANRAELGETLAGLLGRQGEAARERDRAGYAELDTAFHREIVAAAGNTVLLEFYDLLRDRQRRMTVSVLQRTADKYATMTRDHTELARFAAAGDVLGYSTTLRDHLTATHGITLPTSPSTVPPAPKGLQR